MKRIDDYESIVIDSIKTFSYSDVDLEKMLFDHMRDCLRHGQGFKTSLSLKWTTHFSDSFRLASNVS